MEVNNGNAVIPALVSATPVPTLATSTALPVGDAVRAEIATMQQQALALQASIRDLRQRETQLSSSYFPPMPDMPALDGHYSADTVLLLPALALAALLVWIRSRSPSAAAMTPVAVAAPLAEKRAVPRPKDDPHWVDRDLDFVASDHHSDWGQEVVGALDDGPGAESRFWEPEGQSQPAAFDSEIANVEVHKVRASLAHKRAARAMGHSPPPAHLLAAEGEDQQQDAFAYDDPTASYPRISPQAPSVHGQSSVDLELDIDLGPAELHPVSASDTDVQALAVEPDFDGDLGVDLGLEKASLAEVEPSSAFELPREPEPEDPDTEPPSFTYPDDPSVVAAQERGPASEPENALQSASELNPDAPLVSESEESLYEIRLALAQEFLALGLLPGAREIVTELLGSPSVDVREQAHALLAEINLQEGIEDLPLFESSAFANPRSMMTATAAQPLTSNSDDTE